jgi:hypothetical protein
MTARPACQDTMLTSEETAFIRHALAACSQALAWMGQHGGPQGQALLAEAARAAAGITPGHLGYDVSLAIDYLDFAPAARSAR